MKVATRFHHEYSTNKFFSSTSYHCSTTGQSVPIFHDLLDSFQNKYLVQWKEDDIKNVLKNIFKKNTALLILQYILYIQKTDKNRWDDDLQKKSVRMDMTERMMKLIS